MKNEIHFGNSYTAKNKYVRIFNFNYTFTFKLKYHQCLPMCFCFCCCLYYTSSTKKGILLYNSIKRNVAKIPRLLKCFNFLFVCVYVYYTNSIVVLATSSSCYYKQRDIKEVANNVSKRRL